MNTPSSAVIFLNGHPPSEPLIRRLVSEHELVMAADGAAKYLAEVNVEPHIVCGDFDSIDLEAMRRRFVKAEFVTLSDQNFCDGEKALRLAQERGATSVTLTGTVGLRLGHNHGSVMILIHYHRTLTLKIVEDGGSCYALSGTEDAPDELTLTTVPGDKISLASYDVDAKITLEGTKWPLRDEAVIGTRGVSNVAEGEVVRVLAKGGPVIVSHEPGTA